MDNFSTHIANITREMIKARVYGGTPGNSQEDTQIQNQNKKGQEQEKNKEKGKKSLITRRLHWEFTSWSRLSFFTSCPPVFTQKVADPIICLHARTPLPILFHKAGTFVERLQIQ